MSVTVPTAAQARRERRERFSRVLAAGDPAQIEELLAECAARVADAVQRSTGEMRQLGGELSRMRRRAAKLMPDEQAVRAEAKLDALLDVLSARAAHSEDGQRVARLEEQLRAPRPTAKQRVLDQLREGGPQRSSELADQLRLTRSQVSTALTALSSKGMVISVQATEPLDGRAACYKAVA